ncbi:Fe/S biogenesis protein NfuA [subsurface metagenome]|jgi:Fe-S cluster biogenesis protein NfuA
MSKEDIERVLEEIKPYLQADGGDVELVSVEEGVVKVKFLGGCSGCPFRAITLKTGIERYLKEKLPEVKEVISA